MSPVCLQKGPAFKKPHGYWRLPLFTPSASANDCKLFIINKLPSNICFHGRAIGLASKPAGDCGHPDTTCCRCSAPP